MLTYKRNQSLEAASASFGQGPTPSPALKTNAKRLLDADRAFEYSPRSKDPERANYAFFSGKAPGSGVEVLFSSYEVFALRLGLRLLEHGWPQSTAVKVMRRVVCCSSAAFSNFELGRCQAFRSKEDPRDCGAWQFSRLNDLPDLSRCRQKGTRWAPLH